MIFVLGQEGSHLYRRRGCRHTHGTETRRKTKERNPTDQTHFTATQQDSEEETLGGDKADADRSRRWKS